jgi:hypothetical protein
MKIPLMIILFIMVCIAVIHASPYEVLVVGIADANNQTKIEEFRKDAARFNALQHKGYLAAKPYFNVLRMADGRVYFVFGFKGPVQGIHRQNYPGTMRNLRRLKNAGVRKYPNMHWLPVDEIRRLLASP